MNICRYHGLPACIFIMLLPATAPAASKNDGQAFYIAANKVTLSKKKGFSEYTGNVRIQHGNMNLRASHARAQGKSNKPRHIQAWGKPLVVSQKDTKGEININAAHANYRTGTSLLELSGKVNINFEGDQFVAERIYYHPPSGRLWSGNSSSQVSARIKLNKAGKKKRENNE